MSIVKSIFFLTLMIIDKPVTLSINITSTLIGLPEDARLNFTQLAYKYGLVVREYEVITEDGYILKLFNIQGNKKRPVLLAHGIFGTADIYLLRGKTSLGYILAKQGYDVWALNVRGSRYSRKHLTLDPDKDKAFWNFSFHEHGYYDLPANIDFILQSTGQNQLSIIGISEGTTITFVLASMRPEYNEKINVFLALAPVVYLQNLEPPSSILLQFSAEINDLLTVLGFEELFGYNSIFKAIYNIICGQRIGYDLCLKIGFFPVTGADADELEPEFYYTTIGQFPDGTSRKNLAHYTQVGRRRIFAQYDYGRRMNLDMYQSAAPPEYSLNRVTIKVVLICGKNDKLSTLKDVQILKDRLPNVIGFRVMESNTFNHLDHVWGRNVHKVSYPFIIKTLRKFN
ncbi:lipase 1-like [Bombyx mori]|uniref:lipase 1-like n=1 Tax=Bombyx mori TaxID=7091 RepID=UPI00024B998B